MKPPAVPFAFFLSSQVRDFERAWLLADQACKVDSSYADAFFTAGHIAASRADVRVADERLDKAKNLGFPAHRCDLQRARVRLRELEREIDESNARPLDLTPRLKEISRLLRAASLPSLGDDHDRKHQYEVTDALKKTRTIARRYGLNFI
jgi:hypothetical protein